MNLGRILDKYADYTEIFNLMNRIFRNIYLYLERWPNIRSYFIAIYRFILKDMGEFFSINGKILIYLLSPRNIFLRIRSRHLELMGGEQYRYGKLEEAISCWRRSNNDISKVNAQLLRPGDKVRIFGHNYVHSIGHLGLISYHIKMKQLGWIAPDSDFYIIAPNGRTANRSLVHYFRQYASVIEDPALCQLLGSMSSLNQQPLGVINISNRESVYLNYFGAKIEAEWHRQARKPLLVLTQDHRERGAEVLKALTGKSVEKFVVAHIRSRGFHGRYEQDSVRNSDIGTYSRAFDRIRERGYIVIRMGDRTMPPLASTEGVFDYAHSDLRSDWMDIFLYAQAKFMIGTQSGPNVISNLFGVPNADINWAPTAVRPFSPINIFIPKLLRDVRTGALLPFSKQVSAPLGHILGVADLALHGVEAIDNTDIEIEDAIVEMMDRIEGIWATEPEDIELQNRYDAFCLAVGSYAGAPVGRKFLRKYQYLLQ